MIKLTITGFAVILLSSLSTILHANSNWHDFYQIDNIDIPKHIDPQIGGLKVLSDGRVAVAFHAGQVMLYSPESKQWQEFATGLHEPLGLVEEESGALVVMQMPELTRLIDQDKDGKADFYQTLSDDFGMTGNYHEFAFGPARDSKGNFYISLNVASNYAGIFEHIRGEFSELGLSREAMTNFRNDEWKNETRHLAGRMFSKVPYRGWIMKVTPAGKTIPFASGFRSPDGLWVDAADKLWVTDNQGDWLGTSPLYQVKQGHFYGHPASLVWNEGWQRSPVDMQAKELAKMKTAAAAIFPHGELANSPTQPISTVSPEQFGLPKGELLIGDMNQARLIRFLPDEVNGFSQGTLIPFLETEKLGIGNHRFSFDNAGALWLGKTHLGWAGGEGIRKVTWNKQPLFIANKVSLTTSGFEIDFSMPISGSLPAIKVSSHSYHYHRKYGSEKVDLSEQSINSVTLSDDKKKLVVALNEAIGERLYTLELAGLKSETGKELMGDILRYNVVELIK